jgi:hypothetical protein
VAFFGGVAGIVAGSRSKAANALPGVAIATALMPPICAAGFGFAHASPKIFLGALYLFFINTVFISLSAYLIVKLLKFPVKTDPDPVKERKVRHIITSIIVLLTIPSVLIFIDIIKQVSMNNRVNAFISKNISSPERNVIKWNLQNVENDSIVLNIFTVGEKLSPEETDSLGALLDNYRIENARLSLLQVESSNGLNFDEVNNLMISSAELNKKVNEKLNRIDSLQNIINIYKIDSAYKQEIKNDLLIMAPSVRELIFSGRTDTLRAGDTAKIVSVPVLLVEWDRKSRFSSRRSDAKKITELVKRKLKTDTVIINEIK